MFLYVHGEQGRGLAEVSSVEPALSNFLISSFNILFFLLLTVKIFPAWNTFTDTSFLLSTAPCLFINNNIYDSVTSLIFMDDQFHASWLSSKYTLLHVFLLSSYSKNCEIQQFKVDPDFFGTPCRDKNRCESSISTYLISPPCVGIMDCRSVR